MSKVPPKQAGDPETTGHSWDGIEEFNNPLPRWWVWVFYLTIIWGIGYSIAYPAWPMISGATAGVLGFSTRAQVAEEIAAVDAKNQAINDKLAAAELTAIKDDAELSGYARSAGKAIFNTWCIQCHGVEGQGAVGYPTLSDDDWLWGGDIESIHTTIAYGIRNTETDEARYSAMPAFGRDELLTGDEIGQVANFVQSLSGTPDDASQVAAGATLYADNCASCHGEKGEGDRAQGAPNLADAIWLYGGDHATLVQTITNARFGVMPAWGDNLSEAEVRAVSVYVHQLGGGE